MRILNKKHNCSENKKEDDKTLADQELRYDISNISEINIKGRHFEKEYLKTHEKNITEIAYKIYNQRKF